MTHATIPVNTDPEIPSPAGDERTITYRISPPIKPADLHALFLDAGTADSPVDLKAVLKRALFYVGAFDGARLVGFAKVIDDGGVHGFLLDPTVSSALRRRGVGTALVSACVAEAKKRRIEWLHVDFEPRLAPFYQRCGFVPSMAGVMNLKAEPATGVESPSV
jgi:GNAT superfamily N-acetyltransferase